MRLATLIGTLMIALPAALLAQQSGAKVGAIVVAHGAGEDWNRPVIEIAEAAGAQANIPVEVSFLMGDAAPTTRFQDAVDRLVEQGAERIVVVPVLASSHSGHYEQIRYLTGGRDDLDETMMHHLHMAGIHRATANVPIVLTPALDASMEIATILADRAKALATNAPGQALFVMGHGPNSAEDYAGWMANLRPVADSIGRLGGFRDVKVGLVRDDAPEAVREEAVRRIREIIQLQHDLTGQPVVVVPLLISQGYVSQKFRTDLAGLPIAYDGEGLLPHPLLADWIQARVRQAAGPLIPEGDHR